jgi:hypothetical protein
MESQQTCSKCGNEIGEGVKFCPECGRAIAPKRSESQSIGWLWLIVGGGGIVALIAGLGSIADTSAPPAARSSVSVAYYMVSDGAVEVTYQNETNGNRSDESWCAETRKSLNGKGPETA